MKKAELKKFYYYIHRLFTNGYPLRMKLHIIARYFGMAISMLIEKVRGIDYTMLYVLSEDGNAYTKTPKKVLRRVFNDFPEKNDKAFVDVGCGKGYVVSQAIKAGFKYGGGIEYNSHLYEVCIKNLTTEKLSTEYIYNEDAGTSKHLGQFDIYFFNNPFGDEILKSVVENIFESHKDRKCWIYWLNPIACSAKMKTIENAGFHFVKTIDDKNETYYSINVYSNKIE